jgi:hypothetical protein
MIILVLGSQPLPLLPEHSLQALSHPSQQGEKLLLPQGAQPGLVPPQGQVGRWGGADVESAV